MIFEQKWNILAAGLLITGILAVGWFNENKPVCPDDFTDPNEEIDSFYVWWKDYITKNPEASEAEMSEARATFYRENNCTAALKRYDDYIAGRVDEDTQKLIEMNIQEAIQE